MLYIFPQESYTNVSTTKFSLIWNWLVVGERRFVGHQGSVPGITTLMMANEQRNLGVIVLTNGDATRADSQALQVRETIIKLMTQLFDCFETNKKRNI